MPDTKVCEQCGATYERPSLYSPHKWSTRRYCSWACSVAARPVGVRMPCRICGEPTKYYASDRRLTGLMTCGRPECAEQSRALKNERISATQREDFAAGRGHARKGSWSGVPRVSKEETILTDWFASLGWVPQHPVLTGVHTNKLPRMFRLDFALPDRRLYVEVDGTVHRHRDRRERDERRDAMLAGLGWHGLRLSSKLVRDDIDAAKITVLDWLNGTT